MINLAKESNIVTTDLYEIIYIRLCERSKLPDFHHLIQPEIENNITNILYDNLKEVDPVSVVCYGKLSFSVQELKSKKNKIYGYTLGELIHSFKSMGELREPNTGEMLTCDSIEKLEHIANAIHISPQIKKSTKEDARELLKIIHFIRAKSGSLGKKVSDWMENTSKESIPGLLELLNVSMYMRGWRGGNNPYPIKVAPILNQDKFRNDGL